MASPIIVEWDGHEISGGYRSWFERPLRMNFGAYNGSIYGMNFVGTDEKEKEMATVQDVYTSFNKWADAQKLAGKGFGHLMIYGDESGGVFDGNKDEVVSFSTFEEAVRLIREEIEANAPEWYVAANITRESFFLCHRRFALRYPVASDSIPLVAEGMVNQLCSLANEAMPHGFVLPIGTMVNYTNIGVKRDGIIVMVDTSVPFDDQFEGLYLINFNDPNDPDEDYKRRLHDWASADEVTVQPHDPKMRMALLDLAMANGMNVTKLGLLI